MEQIGGYFEVHVDEFGPKRALAHVGSHLATYGEVGGRGFQVHREFKFVAVRPLDSTRVFGFEWVWYGGGHGHVFPKAEFDT